MAENNQSNRKEPSSDTIGYSKYPQWYNGSAMRAPMLVVTERSTSHTKIVEKGLAFQLTEARKQLATSSVPSQMEIRKLNIAIDAINKSTKEKPLTEFELIKILQFRTPRLRHTSKLVKHIVKQNGRKKGKLKLTKLLNNGNSN